MKMTTERYNDVDTMFYDDGDAPDVDTMFY